MPRRKFPTRGPWPCVCADRARMPFFASINTHWQTLNHQPFFRIKVQRRSFVLGYIKLHQHA